MTSAEVSSPYDQFNGVGQAGSSVGANSWVHGTVHPTEWSLNDVISWLGTLSPPQSWHSTSFRQNAITGDVLLMLDNDALLDMGIASVGHRLTLLGAIWRLKQNWGVTIEEGDWKPGASTLDGSPDTSLPALVSALRVRDDRIRTLEGEIAKLADYLSRFQHDFASVCRILGVKNPSSEHPAPRPDPLLFTPESTLSNLALPSPRGANGSHHPVPATTAPVSNAQHHQPDSPRKQPLGVNTSHYDQSYAGPTSALSYGGSSGGASASASGSGSANHFGSLQNASSMLDAASDDREGDTLVPLGKARTPTSAHSLTGSVPNTAGIPSAVSGTSTSMGSHSGAPGNSPTRSVTGAMSSTGLGDEPSSSPTASTPGATPTSALPPGVSRLGTAGQQAAANSSSSQPQHSPLASTSVATSRRALAAPNLGSSSGGPNSESTAPAVGSVSANGCAVGASAGSSSISSGAQESKSSNAGSSADNPYKSFRVTLDDPCHKVLPAALKKYKINDDWRQYALFICYGQTERCLSYDEKPLLLFQKLKEAKQNPVFMLRHIRDVKSPIAIANAKAAQRKNSLGSAASKEGAAETTDAAGDPHSGSSGKSQASKGGSPGGGRVAEAVAKFGGGGGGGAGGSGGKARDGTGEAEDRGGEDGMVVAGGQNGEPFISGPAARLPPATAPPTYAIAIYPYVSERADEFDVGVGDTFVVLSKAKGWWVVQRDTKAMGKGDVVPRKAASESGTPSSSGSGGSSGGEIKSGWVPAGCLLETNRPLAGVLGRPEADPSTAVDPNTPTAWISQEKKGSDPIPPAVITSTSTPGIMLMDYAAPEDRLDLKKDDRLRVFKRYNHWSYCVAEAEGHARGWVPSWCGCIPATLTLPRFATDNLLKLCTSSRYRQIVRKWLATSRICIWAVRFWWWA
ncbi:hypothetical protein IE81DRAFT_23270 [Ceraceosorus guamensis]|uniref:RA-domain-containing protein n=1 Tax=Ceraceosorus guamensis TaxID=1522189 RepID=A0A316VQB1_9BASI|nr:hypothetical protein IE81DRAFT_23270 [Ceraceosorus guamensis]PWN39510.1 hypothetical protein IE81DRAFT_23270 [Ceraceosorus guamensis]